MMQRADKMIAFVCTGNTCRSPMAEGIFNKLASERGLCVSAASFGISAANGMSVSQNSVAVCREKAVDLRNKTSRSVYDVNLNMFDKFYCMSQSHASALSGEFGVASDKISVLNISDPFGGGLDIYRKCRDEIYNAVKEIIKNYED